jgi:hypothetical protein
MKFIRRENLDVQKRITIVMLAIACQGQYGARTALALKYQISRTFLYQLLSTALFCLSELFSVENSESIPYARLDAVGMMVLLRLEGKVSISGIGEILDQQGHPHHSTGLVSECLTSLGASLPNTLISKEERSIIILADEIHALNIPILVSIEPRSTAIIKIELADNRQADTWDKHFRTIEDGNYNISGLCSDRGTGILGGFKSACPNIIWFSDHFHEFNDLRKLSITLESQAYAAIAYEYERKIVLDNAKSESNRQKRHLQLEEATKDCTSKIQCYQHVADVLALLFPSLYFFDLQNGNLRRAVQVKETILTLMDWLDELDYPVLQVETKTIRNHIDDICCCYQKSEGIYDALATTIPENVLNFAGLAWQYDHQSHQYKGERKTFYKNESQFYREIAASLLEEKTDEAVIAEVFDTFDDMNRTSSLIEMVNSLIRPYLNSCKGQITQEHLNLIMFYHNHHKYKTGKRKGKAPIEILNGITLEKHWLDLLLETAEYKT